METIGCEATYLDLLQRTKIILNCECENTFACKETMFLGQFQKMSWGWEANFFIPPPPQDTTDQLNPHPQDKIVQLDPNPQDIVNNLDPNPPDKIWNLNPNALDRICSPTCSIQWYLWFKTTPNARQKWSHMAGVFHCRYYLITEIRGQCHKRAFLKTNACGLSERWSLEQVSL